MSDSSCMSWDASQLGLGHAEIDSYLCDAFQRAFDMSPSNEDGQLGNIFLYLRTKSNIHIVQIIKKHQPF